MSGLVRVGQPCVKEAYRQAGPVKSVSQTSGTSWLGLINFALSMISAFWRSTPTTPFNNRLVEQCDPNFTRHPPVHCNPSSMQVSVAGIPGLDDGLDYDDDSYKGRTERRKEREKRNGDEDPGINDVPLPPEEDDGHGLPPTFPPDPNSDD